MSRKYRSGQDHLKPGLTPPNAGQSFENSQAKAAISSKTQSSEADPWKNTPLPSVADVDEQRVLDPKTLLECCKRAKAFNLEYRFPVGNCRVGVPHQRVLEYSAMTREELSELSDAAKKKCGESFFCNSVSHPQCITGSRVGKPRNVAHHS